MDEIRANERFPAGSLQLRNINCRYMPAGMLKQWIGKKEGEVISGFNVDVPPKAIVALLGPSGSGKTTLLRALGMELPETHPALQSNAVLDVTGELNGKKVHSIRSTKTYVSKHFELLDDPLRGARRGMVQNFIDNISIPEEKKNRGLIFGTYHMSKGLLRAVDKILIMGHPPIYGAQYDPAVLEKLQKYFSDAEGYDERALWASTELSPEKLARAHESSVALLTKYFSDAISREVLSEEMIRGIYEKQVRSLEGD